MGSPPAGEWIYMVWRKDASLIYHYINAVSTGLTLTMAPAVGSNARINYIGTYDSNFQMGEYSDDLNSMINGRENFWFLNYDHPDKFDLNNPDYFTNGGYGVFNSHMSYFGAACFDKILSNDIGTIIGKTPVFQTKKNN